MTPFKSLPENEADILAIKELMIACPIGEVITYRAVSDAIGRDIQIKARYLLQAAIRVAEKETGARYACVHHIGIKRLPVEEIPSIGTACVGKIRRAAQRGIKRLSGVRENAPPIVQKQINAQCAQLGAVALIARNESTKKIEGQTEPSHILPIGKTLALFAQ